MKTIAESYPHLVAQWHPIKNGELKPTDITCGSGRRVWWKCPVADDHEWEARVADATRGGCPFCSGRKICFSNSLFSTHSDMAVQWHLKNKLRPECVLAGCNAKMWWKCPVGDDHEWEATPLSRCYAKTGCPVCAGQKVVLSNSLLTTHPLLSREWNYLRNGELSPAKVTFGSNHKVWWLCKMGHEWKASVGNRSRLGRGPFCVNQKVNGENSLQTTHPDIASEWHQNNKLLPTQVTGGSDRKVFWKCSKNPLHVWSCKIYHRTGSRSGCPFCKESAGEELVGKKLTEIGLRFIKEWKTNECRDIKPLPFDFALTSNTKIVALIEYQGIQHFRPVKFHSDQDAALEFAGIKRRDDIKERFCRDSEIPLLRIHYMDSDPSRTIADFVKSIPALQTENS